VSAALPIVGDWFAIAAADEHGVRRIRERHVHEYGGGSMWLVEGRDACLLVETGLGVAPLRAFVEGVTEKPVIAFASVGYYDHAGGLSQFDERLIHRADADRVRRPTRLNTAAHYLRGAFSGYPWAGFDPETWVMPACEPTRLLDEGDTIDLGDRAFTVLHLPGVTAGASALLERRSGVLFSGEAFVWHGDHVYDGEPAEVSNDADRTAFRASLERLQDIEAAAVYPGHYGRSDTASMREAIAAYLQGHTTDMPFDSYL
jgi:glyoxylase-like metal-dependent hydrolase (beta-lactamase superfamily II)